MKTTRKVVWVAAFIKCVAVTSCIKLPEEPELPKIPDLLAPAHDASLDIRDRANLEFRWATVAGADSYDVQIAVDSSFAPPLQVDTTIAGTSLRPASLATTTYYWRVRAAIGQLPEESVWTPARRVHLVKPEIEVSIRTLNLGERSANTTDPAEGTITIRYGAGGVGKLIIDSLAVITAEANFSVEAKIVAGDPPIALEPGGPARQVKALFHPLSAGDKNADVLIKSNDWDTRRVRVTLRGEGFEPPLGVAVSNNTVADIYNFNNVNQNSAVSKNFVMVNNGEANLTVDSVVVAGNAYFSLTSLDEELPYTLDDDYFFVQPQLRARVTFRPSARGAVEGVLRIVYEYKREKIVRKIKLQGNGI
jgi:hypothetical protein